MTAPLNKPKTPPFKLAGAVLLVIAAVVLTAVWIQFRGGFADPERLTLIAARAGLSMDPGAKVTYNGVEIGRVTAVDPAQEDGTPAAKVQLDVDRQYMRLIPKNVDVAIKATTVFGNKYIAFSSPKNPDPARASKSTPIRATEVTTEFNTLFETVVSVAQQVDPIKLNQTLSATAQALDGLGTRFGQSIDDGSTVLADLNNRMPQLRRFNRGLADLTEVYANAAPDLFDGLGNLATTARTLNEQQKNLDAALMAAVGFGNTGGELFERSAPYLKRALADLVPTSELLDYYSPELFCTIRNYHDVEPKARAALGGGNGYSLNMVNEVTFAGDPYVYPDNLPRVNARGGPEGRPGCWQPITHDLYPAPYLVMDTGTSTAPQNGLGIGSPYANEYVWGRQVGEYTINP